MRYEEIPTIIPTQKEFVSRDLVDQNMYMGYRSIEGTDWYLVSAVPARQVYSEQNFLLRQFLVFSLFLLTISCFMPIITTNNITRRISSVIDQMKAVRDGTLKKLPETKARDEIVFVVSDDGVGIPPEQMEHILTGEGKSKSGNNIDIYNTHRRLQLYYNNPNFGLTYRSSLGSGTEVEVRIPMVEYSPKEAS